MKGQRMIGAVSRSLAIAILAGIFLGVLNVAVHGGPGHFSGLSWMRGGVIGFAIVFVICPTVSLIKSEA